MAAFSGLPSESFEIFEPRNGMVASATHRTVWGEQPQLYYITKPWTGQWQPSTLDASFTFGEPGLAFASVYDPASRSLAFAADLKKRASFSYAHIVDAGTKSIYGHRAYETSSSTSYQITGPSAYIDRIESAACSRVPFVGKVKAYFGTKNLIGAPRYPHLQVGLMIGVSHTTGTFTTFSRSTEPGSFSPSYDAYPLENVYTKDLNAIAVVVDRSRAQDGGVRRVYLLQIIGGVVTEIDSDVIPSGGLTAGPLNSTYGPGEAVDNIELFHNGGTTFFANVTMRSGETVGVTSIGSGAASMPAGLAGVVMSPIKFDSNVPTSGASYFGPTSDNQPWYGPFVRRVEYTELSGGTLGDSFVDNFERYHNAVQSRPVPSGFTYVDPAGGPYTGYATGIVPKLRYFDACTIGMGTRGATDYSTGFNITTGYPGDGIHEFSLGPAASTQLEIGTMNSAGNSPGQRYSYGGLIRSIPEESEQQHRETQITFDSGLTKDVQSGVLLRWSSALDRSTESTSVAAGRLTSYLNYHTADMQGRHAAMSGYACLIEYQHGAPASWVLRLLAYQEPSPFDVFDGNDFVELATADLGSFSLSRGTPITLSYEVQNVDNTFGAGGDLVRHRAQVNGTEIALWTLNPGFAALSQLSAAQVGSHFWVYDQRDERLVTGYGSGLSAVSLNPNITSDTNDRIASFGYFNALDMTLDAGSGDSATFGASIPFDAETAGFTGTLTLDLSFEVQTVENWRQDGNVYETGHESRRLRQSKPRRKWMVQARNTTPAQRAALLTFYEDHKGAEIPFQWYVPNPGRSTAQELVIARFLTQNLGTVLSRKDIEEFIFEIEELFTGA